MAPPAVTLSFDNGPTPGVTDEVLDLLAQRSIRTTFFAVGDRVRVEGGREVLERAHREGHWIGNHSLTHEVQLAHLDAAGVAREIGAAQELLAGLTHPDNLFRPFG